MRKTGFTLVELMVVMAIIAILSVAGFTSYEGSKKAVRDGKRKADLETIRGMLMLYFTDAKQFPGTISPGSNLTYTVGASTVNYGRIPTDPTNTNPYLYRYERLTANTFRLGANMERDNPTGCTVNGATMEYCVTNP